MKTTRSRAPREEWLERVRAWQGSGLTLTEFARRSRLNRGTLSWWKWKLASEGALAARPRGSRSRARAVPLKFVELGPVHSAEAEPRAIELELGRVRIRVPERFDAPTLERVLELLEARA